jgi:hypothetical protein
LRDFKNHLTKNYEHQKEKNAIGIYEINVQKRRGYELSGAFLKIDKKALGNT